MSQDESAQARLRAEAAELKWAEAVEQRRATEARLRLLEAATRALSGAVELTQGAPDVVWRAKEAIDALLDPPTEPSPAGGPSPAT